MRQVVFSLSLSRKGGVEKTTIRLGGFAQNNGWPPSKRNNTNYQRTWENL